MSDSTLLAKLADLEDRLEYWESEAAGQFRLRILMGLKLEEAEERTKKDFLKLKLACDALRAVLYQGDGNNIAKAAVEVRHDERVIALLKEYA